MSRVSKTVDVLNVDFCPWLNGYVYWLKKPIGWVFLALLTSLLLGFYVSEQALIGSAAIIAIAALGIIWPWICLRGLTGQLLWDASRYVEGDSIVHSLRISNKWPWPAFGIYLVMEDEETNRVEDRFNLVQHAQEGSESKDNPEAAAICFSHVAAMAESRFEWPAVAIRRGAYPKGKVKLVTAFPFGVWDCSREIKVEASILIRPKKGRLSDVPETSGAPRNGLSAGCNRVGDDGDWIGVRPFRPGDSLRQVHWAQTARRDSLVVFERQSRSQQQVEIVVDSFHRNPTVTSDDELVRILATITSHLASHSWDVRLFWDGVWHKIGSSEQCLNKWFDFLATWNRDVSTPSAFLTLGASATNLRLGIRFSNHQFGVSSSAACSLPCHWFEIDDCNNPPTYTSTGRTVDYRDHRHVDLLRRFEEDWKEFLQLRSAGLSSAIATTAGARGSK